MFFIELADKLYNSVIVCFCALRSQVGTKCGLGALPHSLWLDVCSNRLAIWMKALWFLCKSMINNLPGIEPLTLGLQGQCFTSTPRGLTERDYCFSNSKHVNYIYLYQALYLWNHWNGPPPLEKPPALIFHLLSALFPYASPTSLNSFCPKWFLQSRKYCGLWAICLKTWLFIIFCWLLVQKYLKKETWALNFPKEWAPPVNNGNTGCEVFKRGIQN